MRHRTLYKSSVQATSVPRSTRAQAGDVLYTSVIPNFGTVSIVYQCRALNASARPTDITIQLLDAGGGNWTTPRLCSATPSEINCVDFVAISAPTVANVFCKIETAGKGDQIRGSLIARALGTDELLAIAEAR
jgi:hypothetical protein